MRILLDTATFLWVAQGARQLTQSARRTFQDPSNRVFFSAVSAWELAVKYALGKLDLPAPPGRLVPNLRQVYRIESLPLDEESCLQLPRLPALHRDPFDRMLICQAIVHGLAILTPDNAIRQYPVRTLW